MSDQPIEETAGAVDKRLREPMSAGRQLAQRIPLMVVKAGFSTLPLAVFAFDVFQGIVDFGNARLADRFLKNIGARIDRLEESERGRERERLKADAIYQMSGRSALQRLLTETNPRMADALARAVSMLGDSDLSDTGRMEIARALDVLTEPSLHLLQTLYRARRDLLTEPELEVVEGDVTKPNHFTALIYASMPLTSWVAPKADLQRSGAIETVIDGGWFGEVFAADKADEGHTVPLARIYEIGVRVVRMCFDDPAVPAFGRFAESP